MFSLCVLFYSIIPACPDIFFNMSQKCPLLSFCSTIQSTSDNQNTNGDYRGIFYNIKQKIILCFSWLQLTNVTTPYHRVFLYKVSNLITVQPTLVNGWEFRHLSQTLDRLTWQEMLASFTSKKNSCSSSSSPRLTQLTAFGTTSTSPMFLQYTPKRKTCIMPYSMFLKSFWY